MLRKPIFCREMNPGEERSVCELVSQVFHEYVAPDYGQEGIEEFFRFADPDAMNKRMQSGGFVLVAYQADILAGMLEFFPPYRGTRRTSRLRSGSRWKVSTSPCRASTPERTAG